MSLEDTIDTMIKHGVSECDLPGGGKMIITEYMPPSYIRLDRCPECGKDRRCDPPCPHCGCPIAEIRG